MLYAKDPWPVPLLLALKEVSSATVPPASGKSIERSAVAFVTEIVVSFASALEPSNVMPEEFRRIPFAASAAPTRTVVVPSSVVDVSDVSPATVVAVAPSEMLVEPTVNELLASWLFGIELVPNSPDPLLYVSPDPDATLR